MYVTTERLYGKPDNIKYTDILVAVFIRSERSIIKPSFFTLFIFHHLFDDICNNAFAPFIHSKLTAFSFIDTHKEHPRSMMS